MPSNDPGAGVATITRDRVGLRPGTLCYSVTSPQQVGRTKIEVLVPDVIEPGRRYPVAYLLPVNVGTDGRWGSGIEEAWRGDLQNRHGVILVAPSFAAIPWYGDHPERPEVRQASFVTDVVVPFVDREFATIATPGGRSVVGFSKSGLGALSLFLRHPDQFGSVAVFDPAPAPSTANFHRWGVDQSHGTRADFDRVDPLPLLARQRGGSRRRARRIVILSGGPGRRTGAASYRERLADLGIPFVSILDSGMAHTWTSGWLPLALAALDPKSA